MIKSYKVRLKPNNTQTTKLFQSAGVARFAYNWCIAKQKENYANGGKFISDHGLRKELTQLKKLPEYAWLNDVSAQIPKQAVKDACETYKDFFKRKCGYPKFKSRKRNRPSFHQRQDQIKIKNGKICIEKIGYIKLSEKERIPIVNKYFNPRVTFDGLNWYFSVGVEAEQPQEVLNDGIIGIDLGVKDLAILDDASVYKNINKSKKVRKLTKRLKRKQKKLSKKYIKNKKGESYRKTCNIVKTEKQALKIRRRISNINNDHLHKVTTEIINRKPRMIILEDLNVKGMLKNHKLARVVQEQSLNKFNAMLCYKSLNKGIEIKRVDRFYPSSKLCSKCGQIKRDLKLSDRVYKCDCGNVMDRDVNAANNLKNYGLAN